MGKNSDEKILNLLDKMNFKCLQCSVCCRIDPGAVFITDEDAELICKYLSIDIKEFLTKYCRGIERNGEYSVSLKEKPNYDCVFWNEKCLIYEARPLQCRTYPYWPAVVESLDSWYEESKRCKGMNNPSDLTLSQKYDLYKKEKAAIIMKCRIS